MILHYLQFFILILNLNAATAKEQLPPIADIDLYKMALDNKDSKKSCEVFKELKSKKDFSLNELAWLRYSEYCNKKVNWENLYKSITTTAIKPFLIKLWYEDEFNKKKYAQAYRLWKNNRSEIQLDKKEFEILANYALKSSLKLSEKKELQKELEKKAPRFKKKIKKDDYIKVAKDYRTDRQFDKALTYYKKVINDSSFSYHQRWHAFNGARLTYKLERWTRMTKYIEATKQWAHFLRAEYKWSQELTRLHHDANIEYIRTLWTEKGQTLATKELNRLEKELKNRYSLQIVYWLKGRMEEEKTHYDKAVYWLDKSAKEKKISNSDLERTLWALAWNQRRIKQYENSQTTLEVLKKHPDITFFGKSKFLYWQAENLDSLGKKEEAKEAFKNLAELDLYGYYGALAYRKINLAFPQPPKKKWDVDTLLSFFEPKDKQYLNDLLKVEELEIAEKLTLEKVKTDNDWNANQWAHYLSLLQYAGAFKTSFIRYHTLKPSIQQTLLEEHPYLLFPQPYKKEVSESSKKSSVSAALIYSIMKQESGFDIKARSHADAFGLLQLIPQIAQKAADRVPSVAYSKPHDLFKPQIAIPLGADNLSQLFSKFDSTFILSVASYNASEKAVRSWIQSRFHGDPITFIEDIPYEETKGYVKLVMRNYIAYNRFDSEEEKFFFPDICLQGIQNFKK
jgi:soluble lytic murein transglycosylase